MLKRKTVLTLIHSLTPAEKMLIGIFLGIAFLSGVILLNKVNDLLLIEVPARGGQISEGIVGSPRFINPLIAISDADRDLTLLVYSGLMKATPDGRLIPDLAESYTISEDGLVYTFTLRENLSFHDDTPITTNDVLFTILKAQDPALKSPKRASWNGIAVQQINEKDIQFTLKRPYAPFLENTTLGILPKHIWEGADIEQFPFSQFNIEPIGSGPYRVTSVKRNASGIPEWYELSAFKKYTLGTPYMTHLFIQFYANEDELVRAFKKGSVLNIHSITAEALADINTKESRVIQKPLPRIFAVFFNQNQASVLAHKEVRRALDVGLDKEYIVRTVLGGYGTEIKSPIPPGILPPESGGEEISEATTPNTNTDTPSETATNEDIASEETPEYPEHIMRARTILENGGWKWNKEIQVWEKKVKKADVRLQFSLATSNAPELKHTAEIIASSWREIGIPVDLQIFEIGDLNQNIIRPRKYESLFFGEIVGRELDLFAFWHSSQRNDPGLNIALYANIASDKLLEEARATTDTEERFSKYREFEKEVESDVPAVFTYSPDFVYIVPDRIQAVNIGSISTPSERFLNIHEWYTNTDKVWGTFAK